MQGSCLCGAVTLAAPDRSEVGVCHCGMCRKWGGGPLFAIQCGTAVSITGEDQVGTFASSPWAERGFCRTCGTHLFYRLTEGGSYAVPAGLFQGEVGFELESQIFIDKKPAYYALSNQTPTLTEREVMEQFGADLSPGD